MELSGATTANWVAKSANLLVDSLGAPDRVGLLLPLHWQTVVLVLAGVATGATVVLAGDVGELTGCGAAFVDVEHAVAAMDAGVDEVLALSGHPFGTPVGSLPSLVLDYAREVPGHGDHFGGARPRRTAVEVFGEQVEHIDDLRTDDRVLTALGPVDEGGAGVLLGALSAGAGLVLLRESLGLDVAKVSAAERITVTAGCDVAGVRRLM